jgi:heptosyltransferase-2
VRFSRVGRTLVIGANWLGDTIMSLPALAAMAEMCSGDLHVLCPRPLGQVIGMAHLADGIWEHSKEASLMERVRLARRVGAKRAVLFPNSLRSALVVSLAGVSERWGYCTQGRGPLLTHRVKVPKRRPNQHHSEHYLGLIRAMGWEGTPPRYSLAVPEEAWRWARSLLDDGEGPWVGICPGAAYGPAKRWPSRKFVELGRRLIADLGVKVVLMGNRDEEPVLRQMCVEMGKGVVNLGGQTDLEGLAAAMKRCSTVVSNDSGPMHLAAALGVPVVAIFGSTDPSLTHPLGPHKILASKPPCSPCMRRKCPLGHYRCLEEISVEDVMRATEEFLLTSE